MFRSYTVKMIERTWQLFEIYESALKYGKFDRKLIANETNIAKQLIEGKWYSECKRTKKFGINHDWKTVLNNYVTQKILKQEKESNLIN